VVGHVQKIRRQYNTKWGICRNLVDLMNKTTSWGKKVSSSPTIMVLLHWFRKVPGNLKFKYDGSDTQWIDLEAIISTMSMTFSARTNMYTLDQIDA
jgi:hypothetical protein